MAVEVPFPFELFLIVPALLGGVLLAVRFAPAIVTARRQAAYETVIASERVRLELAVPANQPADPQAALELIRALHPRQRRGVDGWRVGWPPFELRALWRDGELVWQLETGRQMAAHLQAALRSLYPGTEIELVGRDDQPPLASAVGSLVAPAHWPFGDAAEAGHVLVRLASRTQTLRFMAVCSKGKAYTREPSEGSRSNQGGVLSVEACISAGSRSR